MEAIFANIQNASFVEDYAFLEGFFAENNYIVYADSFFICFWQFYFLTQTHDFTKPIAFAWRPFLPIFKVLSFFEYKVFFKAVFSIE